MMTLYPPQPLCQDIGRLVSSMLFTAVTKYFFLPYSLLKILSFQVHITKHSIHINSIAGNSPLVQSPSFLKYVRSSLIAHSLHYSWKILGNFNIHIDNQDNIVIFKSFNLISFILPWPISTEPPSFPFPCLIYIPNLYPYQTEFHDIHPHIA